MLMVVITGSFLNSCDTTDLDLRDNPNILTSGDPNLLLNNIQLGYRNNVATFNNLGGQLTRIQYMGGRDYFNNFQGPTTNGAWGQTYTNIFTNLQEIERINENSDIDYSFHVALGKIAQAHSLIILVDLMGEAAYSEAVNPAEFPAPLLDDGASVYAAALSILDEAKSLMNSSSGTQGATDFYYNGDTSKWIMPILSEIS